jgi:serine/threonine protein kinase
MYEMATGRLPFGGASPSDTVNNILENDPIPLTQLAPDRPASLERVVTRLLAKPADERFQTAGELHAALASLRRPAFRWRHLFGER